MEIREVAVVGLGTMGAGIAEVFGRAGMTVVGIEADPDALARGVGILTASLSRAVSRGRLTEQEQADILRRIRPGSGFEAAAGADLAIEAVPERLELKRQVFAGLDRACRPDAILATNTSSLSVTAVAAGTAHPGRVVGMHFFNPAPVMRLVEVVTTVLTEAPAGAAIAGLARRLGKTPVQAGDRAGFVANALLLPYLNHAVSLLAAGYATREDIDTAAMAGIGLPMGPLALLDLIGLDTALSILEVLQAEFGGSRCIPAPLLRRLTEAGQLGRKSGRGLYDYGEPAPDAATLASIRNDKLPPAPRRVTLISAGGAEDAAGELAGAIAAAGISVTRNAAEASDLILICAPPTASVLPAALGTGRPDQAAGLWLTGDKLTELVTTRLTSASATAAATALAGRLGWQLVRSPDRPGFLTGALLYPHLADAVRMVQDCYAGAADVDAAMTLGCGYPRGPMRILDDIGPEVALAALRAMHEAYGDPAFAPPPLLAEHAAAGLPFSG